MKSALMYPKLPKEEKKREGHYYFNSTIRIKEIKPRQQRKNTIKCKQKTAKKLKGEYWSVFTSDMHHCIISGTSSNVQPHHIFDAALKTFSEKYGFIIPLAGEYHTLSSEAIHNNRDLDLYWKCKCEDYWINVLDRTKEEWLKETGKWWSIE